MPTYQKAYHLKQLRAFPQWNERSTPQETSATDEPAADRQLTDESVVFLHEDLSVTGSCFDDDDIIFNDASPEWEAFCRDVLEFKVPDWEAEAQQVHQELAKMEAESNANRDA